MLSFALLLAAPVVVAHAISAPALAATAPAVLPAQVVQKIDALFDPWTRSDAPGCAISVTRDGQAVFERGYGMADLEQGVAIRPDTVFNIASLSKQFTTTSISLLEQDGKLSWDDDVRRYIPELPDYGTPITLRHLANHTSGLRDWLGLLELAGWNWVDEATESQVLSAIVRQKQLNFPTGSRYLYSNSGYILLAIIVDRVSGQSLGDFSRARIFEPLGMLHTRFYDDRTMIMPNRAIGHLLREDGSLGIWRPTYEIVGDGAVLTSVQDMQRWERNFLTPTLGREPQALVDGLLRNGVLNDGKQIDYALALTHGQYRGLPTVSHSGGIPGYATNMLRFPTQRVSVTVLCNQGSSPATALTQAVADVVLDGRFSSGSATKAPERPGPYHPDPKQAKASIAVKLDEHVGRYYSDELDVAYTLRADTAANALVTQIGHLPPVRFVATRADHFEGASEDNDGVTLDFQRDAGGKVTGFTLETGRLKGLGFQRVQE
jgi:CubicO group peptidase (beta-lactamase class C family)